MNMSYISVTLPKEELMDLYKGLLAQYVIEQSMRREKGLEDVDYPENLSRLEEILGVDEDRAHLMFHQMENELWEYSWFTYTDEWAWHRAKAETEKELGDKASGLKREAMERLIEERYEKNFDKYVAEIDMKDEQAPVQAAAKREKKKK